VKFLRASKIKLCFVYISGQYRCKSNSKNKSLHLQGTTITNSLTLTVDMLIINTLGRCNLLQDESCVFFVLTKISLSIFFTLS